MRKQGSGRSIRNIAPLTNHRRSAALAIGLGLLLATVIGGVLTGRERARRGLDDALAAEAEIQESTIREFASRGNDVALLLSQSPSLRTFYDQPVATTTRRRDETVLAGVHDALGFIETLYPDRLAEVCFIDRSGAENARIVDGMPAPADQLSLDESGSSFFRPTLKLGVGGVFHSAPYRSPDTGEWVVSHSTPIADSDGHVHSLLHFEITVESLRETVVGHAGRRDVVLVEARTGRVIIDSNLPDTLESPAGAPAELRFHDTTSTGRTEGYVTLDGRRMAFRRITSGPSDGNDWYVFVGDDRSTGWFGQWSTLQLALSSIAVAMAALWIWAMWLDARRLQRVAETDALTGLPNRVALHRAVAEACEDRDDDQLSAVMMLDLDRFKEVNDTLGHHQGDALLRIVSERLRRCLRPDDIVARLGGDEFGVLLGVIDSSAAALVVAKRIRTELDQPFALGDTIVQIGGSVGVAVIPDHGTDVHTLLQRADVAMYDAKTTGRGWTMYQSERDPYGQNHVSFVSELRTMIEVGGLDVHYQPIVDLMSGEVRSVEALVRWQHPERGLLQPEEFVPIAERAGLIRNLTTAVVRRSMVDAARWTAAGHDLGVAINLAGVSLRDTAVVEEISEILAAVALPAVRITVEITESAMLIEKDRTRECFDRLRAIGVKVALDDFGTGYASFVHLKELAVDVLKIDRQFVAAIHHSEIDELIVRSTIALGNSLGVDVVAEGIEDSPTYVALRDWGCTMGQGFLMARPMPIDDLLIWLAESGWSPSALIDLDVAGVAGG